MDKSQLEGLKEISRWVLLYIASFIVSWFITETAGQVTNVPEFFKFNIWVFSYAIPFRQIFTFILTLLGRFIDKYLHELGKTSDNSLLKGGLTRF